MQQTCLEMTVIKTKNKMFLSVSYETFKQIGCTMEGVLSVFLAENIWKEQKTMLLHHLNLCFI